MRYIIFFISILVLTLSSCDEIGPDINPISQNTGSGTDSLQPKRVLVEEFTGVQCSNCPPATTQLNNLVDSYNGRLVIVTVHTGFFASPISGASQFDFSTQDGADLGSHVGPITANPSATIDRKLFDAENALPVSNAVWAGYISQRADLAPQLGIDVNTSFDATSRNLDIDVNLDFYEDVSSPLKLTVFLTENNIVDAQLAPGNQTILDYVHKYVLRDIITPVNGKDVAAQTSGSDVSESFATNLPSDWMANNCYVVVALSKADGSDMEVLQCAQVAVE